MRIVFDFKIHIRPDDHRNGEWFAMFLAGADDSGLEESADESVIFEVDGNAAGRAVVYYGNPTQASAGQESSKH